MTEHQPKMLAAQEETVKRDPYRQLTSLTHVIGKRAA